MQIIYQKVVEKMKHDSIQRYQQRKRDFRLRNNIQEQAIDIQPKRQPRQLQNERPVRSAEEPRKTRAIQNIKQQIWTPANQANTQFRTQTNHTSVDKEDPIRPIRTNQTLPDPFESQNQPVQLVPCPAGCGRKFNPTSMVKHAKACKRVFQTKSEAVDFAQKREVAGMETVQRTGEAEDPNKKANYKAKSNAFRIQMKMNRGQALSEQQQEFLRAVEQARPKCGKCGRKFDQSKIQKHVAMCKSRK